MHTQGPWHLRPDPDDREAWVIIDGTHGYFRVCDVSPRFARKEELANARLIQSAPDLLAALIGVCERGDTDHSAKSMYWIASNALKAAGYDSNGKPITTSTSGAKP